MKKSTASPKTKKTERSPQAAEAVTTKTETRVEIKPAKGRPMLTWVGKKPLRYAIAYPAQLAESFNAQSKEKKPETWTDWNKDLPQAGLLFHGDNKDVLAYLLANGFRGKVKLIYIDPPFDSGADYVRKVNLRGSATRLESESYTLGEQIQYTDIWANDNYLQFMYERFLMLKELLAEDGNIFVHCDDAKNFYLRAILEEVFSGCFRNEIIWKRSTSTGLAQKRCGTLHDSIYWYSKTENYIFNMQYHAYEEDYLKRAVEDENSRLYIPIPTGNPGPRPNLYYEYKGYWPHPNGYKWTKEKMEEFDNQGRLIFPEDKNGRIQYKQYLDEMEGVKLQDLWTDVYSVNPVAIERTPYPTQKPEALLERIIKMASNEENIVLDCFIGSGTTAAVAQKLGRRWIGADINKGAIQTTVKRLQSVMQEQAERAKGKTQSLPGMEAEEPPAPAQLGFAVYRVNDYDLQIQHNEAFNLAVEHLGMIRTKTDAFFDGTLGKKLVKIVPFNHPVTPLDLEEVKNELKNRSDEKRDVAVVGLGKEYAVGAWLEEWNRFRKQEEMPNKIEVIELRSDPKYGGFFTHEPARAKVSFKRVRENIEITIDDFISPTILERLKQQNKDNPLFQPQVSDWRSMVESVMIDADYDGSVFNITLADVPERKNDLVEGKYVMEAKKGATVAVKVTDMLGEEVLVVKSV